MINKRKQLELKIALKENYLKHLTSQVHEFHKFGVRSKSIKSERELEEANGVRAILMKDLKKLKRNV